MGLNCAGQEAGKMLGVNAMAENAIFRATRALPCARYPRAYPAEVPCAYPEVPCGDCENLGFLEYLLVTTGDKLEVL